MKKVVADKARCMGNGNCVMSAPHLFAQGEDDGLVQVIKADLEEKDLESAELAVNSCPSQALTIIDVSE